jgi:hypothetical protein
MTTGRSYVRYCNAVTSVVCSRESIAALHRLATDMHASSSHTILEESPSRQTASNYSTVSNNSTVAEVPSQRRNFKTDVSIATRRILVCLKGSSSVSHNI